MALHAADPGDTDLLYMIASEHVAAGEHGAALPWLAQYVERGRDVGAGWALAADCHLALDAPDRAREALEQGIAAAMRAGHPTMAGELRGRIEDLDSEE